MISKNIVVPSLCLFLFLYVNQVFHSVLMWVLLCILLFLWGKKTQKVSFHVAGPQSMSLCVLVCMRIIISVPHSWNVKNVNCWVKGHSEMSLLGRLVKLCRLMEEKHLGINLWSLNHSADVWQRKSYRGIQTGLSILSIFISHYEITSRFAQIKWTALIQPLCNCK